MKILVATGLYPPEIGGPATYTKMLEEHLPKEGIELSVVPFGMVRKYPKLIRHCMFARELWRKSKEVDVIYALDPVSVGLPALMVSYFRRIPFILRLGGDYAWEQGRQRFGVEVMLDEFSDDPRKYGIRVALLAWLQSFVAKRAQRVIVPSKYLGSIVEKWGVPVSSIVVIHSALFSLPVQEEKESLRKKLSFSYPTIVTAGRLAPWKGFAELIEVVEKLRMKFPTLLLVISGDGPEEKRLQEMIARKKLEDSVRLLGNLSKEALGGVIKAGDVFVLNTGYEGLSHQLLEVMEIGTPIVTTSVGGNPELITNNETGLTVPYKDNDALAGAIERIVEDTELQSRLTANAKEKVMEFSKDKVVKDVVDLLHSVYGEK